MLIHIKKRVAVGFAFVSILLSTFFAIWSFINDFWGPSTGSIVFNTINLGAVAYLGYHAFVAKKIEPEAENLEFDEV